MDEYPRKMNDKLTIERVVTCWESQLDDVQKRKRVYNTKIYLMSHLKKNQLEVSQILFVDKVAKLSRMIFEFRSV